MSVCVYIAHHYRCHCVCVSNVYCTQAACRLKIRIWILVYSLTNASLELFCNSQNTNTDMEKYIRFYICSGHIFVQQPLSFSRLSVIGFSLFRIWCDRTIIVVFSYTMRLRMNEMDFVTLLTMSSSEFCILFYAETEMPPTPRFYDMFARSVHMFIVDIVICMIWPCLQTFFPQIINLTHLGILLFLSVFRYIIFGMSTKLQQESKLITPHILLVNMQNANMYNKKKKLSQQKTNKSRE